MPHLENCSELIFTSAFSTSVGGVQLLCFAALLWWQHDQLRRSRRGDYSASRFIVTPAYMIMVWAFGITLVTFAFGNLYFHTKPYVSRYDMAEGVYWAFNTFAFHFVLDGIAIFFCMEGIGVSSLRRAALLAGIWSLFLAVGNGLATTTIMWAPDGDLEYGNLLQNIFSVINEIFYLLLIFLPFRVLRRRPAVIFYATAWAIYLPLLTLVTNLMYFGYDAAFCAYAGVSWVAWGVAKPLVLYRTLQIDSLYWQGLYTGGLTVPCSSRRSNKVASREDDETMALTTVDDGSQGSRRSRRSRRTRKGKTYGAVSTDDGERYYAETVADEEADIRKALLGTSLDGDAAQALAVSMDEMSQVCPVLPFPELSLTDGSMLGGRAMMKVLGAGGTAKVFEGMYHGKIVAIKMLYCVTLVPETIANFARENALLCSIRHPNIVQVEGICVIPPCICSVMELCTCSLFELLQRDEARFYDWGTRLSLGIDCANGVACLHGQGIVHMDLKSSNFLVGGERVSSWTPEDVALWLETEGLPEFKWDFRGIGGWTKQSKQPGLLQLKEEDLLRIVPARRRGLGSRFDILMEKIRQLQEASHRHSFQHVVVKLTDLELSLRDERVEAIRRGRMVPDSTFAGATNGANLVPQTLNWTAPEVMLRGQEACTTAADVYSLAMTLWEILTGQAPFDEEGMTAKEVQRQVCDLQQRPFIPPNTEPAYAKLLRRAWAQAPEARPSAAEIRDELINMRRRWALHHRNDATFGARPSTRAISDATQTASAGHDDTAGSVSWQAAAEADVDNAAAAAGSAEAGDGGPLGSFVADNQSRSSSDLGGSSSAADLSGRGSRSGYGAGSFSRNGSGRGERVSLGLNSSLMDLDNGGAAAGGGGSGGEGGDAGGADSAGSGAAGYGSVVSLPGAETTAGQPGTNQGSTQSLTGSTGGTGTAAGFSTPLTTGGYRSSIEAIAQDIYDRKSKGSSGGPSSLRRKQWLAVGAELETDSPPMNLSSSDLRLSMSRSSVDSGSLPGSVSKSSSQLRQMRASAAASDSVSASPAPRSNRAPTPPASGSAALGPDGHGESGSEALTQRRRGGSSGSGNGSRPAGGDSRSRKSSHHRSHSMDLVLAVSPMAAAATPLDENEDDAADEGSGSTAA